MDVSFSEIFCHLVFVFLSCTFTCAWLFHILFLCFLNFYVETFALEWWQLTLDSWTLPFLWQAPEYFLFAQNNFQTELVILPLARPARANYKWDTDFFILKPQGSNVNCLHPCFLLQREDHIYHPICRFTIHFLWNNLEQERPFACILLHQNDDLNRLMIQSSHTWYMNSWWICPLVSSWTQNGFPSCAPISLPLQILSQWCITSCNDSPSGPARQPQGNWQIGVC